MITIKDLYDIVGKKITNGAGKAIVKSNLPQDLAEQMCDAINRQERAEHFKRLLTEYNVRLQNQHLDKTYGVINE